MSYDARLTLLSAHADRLNEGLAAADSFIRRQGGLAPDMAALLSLARRLKQTLVPVAAPEPFRTQLYNELVIHSELSYSTPWPKVRRPLVYSLAAIGSVLPLLGIVVWRRRRRLALDAAVEGSEKEYRGPVSIA